MDQNETTKTPAPPPDPAAASRTITPQEPSTHKVCLEMPAAGIGGARMFLPDYERSWDLISPDLRKALVELATGKAKWPLFLYGPTGRGKTTAALAFCDRVYAHDYRTVEELCDATMDKENPSIAFAMWQSVECASLATLDEIGCRERVGELHYSCVKKFTDFRDLKKKRVAIYISNVEPGDIDSLYDNRIASRMLCGTLIHLQGQDRRFV